MLNIDLANMPNVYGEGTIFAFSGIDGQTNIASEFVGTFANEAYGIVFHTPTRRVLNIAVPQTAPTSTKVATGDVLWVDCKSEPLIITWSAWHTVVGQAPKGSSISLAKENEVAEPTEATIITESERDVIVLIKSQNRFAIAYAENLEIALGRAENGLNVDLYRTVAARLAWYEKLKHPVGNDQVRLANKCLSVMKVNTLAPEATFQDYWSTPDRVPHRNLWLWDSVFHAVAMTQIDPTLAWYFLKSVLDMQADDGMIPISGSAEGIRAQNMTQPPLLAWGVWVNYQATGNPTQLAYAFPRLEAYLSWNLANRDSNDNNLLEWDIEEDELCRSGESGMDNSPRFDDALLLDSVDFSTFQAHDMWILSQIAAELGHTAQATFWQAEASKMSQQIYAELWSDEHGLYMDQPVDGNPIAPVAASSGFLPLMLPDIPPAHIEKLAETLQDPTRFWSAFPIPSVAIDNPKWSTDMWRGSTWLNFNYLIMLGLQRHGQDQLAHDLRSRTLDMVSKYYEQYGILFEFYDALDERPPHTLDRKGAYQPPYDFRERFHTIRDFHWTAAVVFMMLLDAQQN